MKSIEVCLCPSFFDQDCGFQIFNGRDCLKFNGLFLGAELFQRKFSFFAIIVPLDFSEQLFNIFRCFSSF